MRRCVLLFLLLASACHNVDNPIFENSSYKWYPDRIVQGEYTGVAESAYKIVSDYDNDTLVWECKNDLSNLPKLTAPTVLEEAVYNMALDESVNAVEPDGTLRTGIFWGGVWTRDVSYSTILSMSYIQPKAAMISLLCKVGQTGLIIQDTGTGGAWPCSTDREIWTVAAWELYKVTGDASWLEKVYPVVKKTISVDMDSIYDESTGLARGESSFIDWRQQSYPRWMQPADIYDSKCLGTNMVHFAALLSAAEMADLSNDSAFAQRCREQAENLKMAINTHLWMEDAGYYAQYLAGRNHDLLYTKSETLGQALTILYGVAEGERAERLSQAMPIVDLGAPVFYPWIPDIPPYHNRAVWPFVQSFWMQACAKTGNEAGVMNAVGSLYRAAALYATNKENFVADDGNWKGTQINSSNMLWSLSGALSITFKVFFGMEYGADALYFSPLVPEKLSGERKVENFPYRNAVLDIELSGYGDTIKLFELDGQALEEACVPADLEGEHTIKIVLSDSFAKDMTVNLQPALNTLMTPDVVFENNVLTWNTVDGAVSYVIYVAGEKYAEIADTTFSIPTEVSGDVQIVALSEEGVPSFPSEPVAVYNDIVYNWPDVLLKKASDEYKVNVSVPENGQWTLVWNYANGNGDITTDRKCAIRTLYVDGNRKDICVFPQRGENTWDDWGYTSPVTLDLAKGEHVLSLRFNVENDNMHLEINDFALRGLVLRRIN